MLNFEKLYFSKNLLQIENRYELYRSGDLCGLHADNVGCGILLHEKELRSGGLLCGRSEYRALAYRSIRRSN